MIAHSDIKLILPHRYPMLLVDVVRTIDAGSRIVAIKNISRNEPCFAAAGERDDACAYPPSLIIESFCQSAGVLQVLSNRQSGDADEQVMLFGSMSEIEFHDHAYAGDTLVHHVQLETTLSDAAVFSGEVRICDRVIVTVGRVVVALRPASALAAAASDGSDTRNLVSGGTAPAGRPGG